MGLFNVLTLLIDGDCTKTEVIVRLGSTFLSVYSSRLTLPLVN